MAYIALLDKRCSSEILWQGNTEVEKVKDIAFANIYVTNAQTLFQQSFSKKLQILSSISCHIQMLSIKCSCHTDTFTEMTTVFGILDKMSNNSMAKQDFFSQHVNIEGTDSGKLTQNI